MNKRLCFLVVFMVFLVPVAYGLTASIGNAKAIVNVNLKESNVLERTVLVKNVNNESVSINLEAADDLEEITEIIDKEFTLNAGEDKNARFKVTIPGEGTYNGNLLVFFNPFEGKGAGVVLQSNLIIKAYGNNIDTNKEDESDEVIRDESSEDTNAITGSTVLKSEDLNIGPALIVFIILIAIIVISVFILLMKRL